MGCWASAGDLVEDDAELLAMVEAAEQQLREGVGRDEDDAALLAMVEAAEEQYLQAVAAVGDGKQGEGSEGQDVQELWLPWHETPNLPGQKNSRQQLRSVFT